MTGVEDPTRKSRRAGRFELPTSFELTVSLEAVYLVIREVADWPTW